MTQNQSQSPANEQYYDHFLYLDDNIRFIDPDPYDILKKKHNDETTKKMKNMDNGLSELLKSNPNITQNDLDNLLKNRLNKKEHNITKLEK